jgi:excisionase family DNA binding protein
VEKPTTDTPLKDHSDDEFLTIAESAPIARLSASSLYDACQRKIIPHYRVSGRRRRGKVLIKRSDLMAFIESMRVEVGEAPPPAAVKPPRPHLRHLSLD